MIAAKAFDPLLGVDVHIIQPPGPVPPVPVPHPFVGMLIDPFDFAPIIGSTVSVNGLPRATAGTGGQCIPPHIPIGGTFVKPPANECDVFMGSSTVLADGEPLSFLGMPALSCHCIGMPPIPRARKKRRVKSLVMPTTVVLAVPMGAPVLVGGPPTVSMMALGMRAGMAALGKAFKKLRKVQKASRRMKALSDKAHAAAQKAMNRLGVPPSVQNRVHRAVCSVTGHPVDVATGKVFTEAVDVELPGPIPFRWERVWYSCSTYAGPLGHGWHHAYDTGLCEDGGAIAIRLPDGRPLAFPALGDGERAFDPRERLELAREGHEYRLTMTDQSVLRFAADGHDGVHRLRSIGDACGNEVRFRYDGEGRLLWITDSGGRSIQVVSDAAGRITALMGPHPTDTGARIPLVSYRYDTQGNLVEARDAMGGVSRYEYRGHLMTAEIDRDGFRFFFEYDGDGPSARCIRTWGDGGIFARRIRYDPVAGTTWVTDPAGAVTTYVSNPLGLVESVTDPSGRVRRFEWDDRGLKIAEADGDGNEVRWEYDEAGRLLSQRLPSGEETRFAYNGMPLPTSMIAADGGTWTRGFDARGLLLYTEDPLGRRYEYSYTSRGQVETVRDPLAREMRIEYDASGLPVSETDWMGGRTTFAYDRLGRLTQLTRADGSSYRFERDLLGRVRRLTRPDGTQRWYAYDPGGALREMRDEQGAVWQFEHAFPGRLTRRVGPDGGVHRWQYDGEGRELAIQNPLQEIAAFARDEAGRVVRERRFDGVERRFVYPGGGDSHEERWPDGSVLRIDVDALGQIRRYTDDRGGSAAFDYDGMGRVVRAENACAVVSFRYDQAGALVEERVDQKAWNSVPAATSVVRSAYDSRGRRIRRERDGGPPVGFDYDANGWLTRVTLGEDQAIEISRDALGRPVRVRLPGGIDCIRQYDACGRLVLQEARGRSAYRREYSYSVTGEPSSIAEDGAPIVGVAVDAVGQPVEIRLGRRAPVRLARNAVGDPLLNATAQHLAYEAGGRLRQLGSEVWHYDARGCVTEQVQRHRRRTFTYDGNGRLTAVHQGDQLIAEYGYDPFGRRLWKRCAGILTRFVWDGDRMVAELGPDGATDYVFEPLSFVPLARISDAGVEAFHCDHLGTPFLLTGPDGATTWRGDFDLEAGVVARPDSPRRQPLRFQGQYADDETGLHYNRHRYYDPRAGRFLSPDPLGLSAGLDLYAYVPNPLSWIDPFGLAFERPYGGDEVGEILDQSEGRASPTTGQPGHPRSSHVNVPNADLQRRADAPGPPATVTTFESNSAQTRAATEALNSPQGQACLRDLDNNPALNRVRIQTTVTGETLRTAQRGRGYITRQTGPRMTVTVIVDVLDRTPGAERIHIQTCYGRY